MSKLTLVVSKTDTGGIHFCYDYGKGGIEVAEEVDGQLIWKKQLNKATNGLKKSAIVAV